MDRMKNKYFTFIGIGLIILAVLAYYIGWEHRQVELLVFLASLSFFFILVRKMMQLSYELRD